MKFIESSLLVLFLAQSLVRLSLSDQIDVEIDSVSGLLKRYGYSAKDHYIATGDGYVINIVQANNQQVGDDSACKVPKLFVHGTKTNGNVFLFSAEGAHPGDLTDVGVNNLSVDELDQRFGHQPNARSLPVILLDYGCPVYFLNRRGVTGSQNRTKDMRDNGSGQLSNSYRLSLDRNFWNFSMDEQAFFDLPKAINFVRADSGSDKVSLIGQSVGAALILMSLIVKPKIADNVDKAVLWSPSFNLGHGDGRNPTPTGMAIAANHYGPVPLALSTHALKLQDIDTCSRAMIACNEMIEQRIGTSKGQGNVTLGYLKAGQEPDSDHTLYQLLESATKKAMHFFDWQSPERNMIAYNQTEPPQYKTSLIRLKNMFFRVGNSDNLVSIADLNSTTSGLRVPYNSQVIGGQDIYFNHNGYFLHRDAPILAIWPAFKYLVDTDYLDQV